jgi:hypothetical protein
MLGPFDKLRSFDGLTMLGPFDKLRANGLRDHSSSLIRYCPINCC